MIEWCKIFEVDDQQVLFFYELDTDRSQRGENVDYYSLHQMVSFAGVACDVKMMGFAGREHVQGVFDALTEESAKTVLEQFKQIIQNPDEKT